GRKLELAVHRLRPAEAFEPERPGQLLRTARPRVRLQVRLGGGVRLQDLERRRDLPLPGAEELLFLRHRPSLAGVCTVRCTPGHTVWSSILRHDLHRGPLYARARRFSGTAESARRAPRGGRAPLSRVAPPSPF